MVEPALVSTAALLYVPTTVAFFRQSILVHLIYFTTATLALWRHLHPSSDEYLILEGSFAILAVTVSLVILAAIQKKYGFRSWRTLGPAVTGIAATALYFLKSNCGFGNPECRSTSEFVVGHSVWHGLLALSGTLLTVTPVDFPKTLQSTYWDILK